MRACSWKVFLFFRLTRKLSLICYLLSFLYIVIFFMKRGFEFGRFQIFDIEPRRNSFSDGLVADLTSSNDLLVGHKLAAIKSRWDKKLFRVKRTMLLLCCVWPVCLCVIACLWTRNDRFPVWSPPNQLDHLANFMEVTESFFPKWRYLPSGVLFPLLNALSKVISLHWSSSKSHEIYFRRSI